MRVLICGEVLHLGGAETVSIDLANALAARGIETRYAAAPGPLEARLAQGVRLEATPRLGREHAFAWARRMAAILRGFRPDVVHAQGATLALCTRAVAALPGARRPALVLTHHSTSYRRASAAASRWLLRAACDQLVAISTAKRAQFLAMGFPAERVAFIPNFVDCAAIRAAASSGDRERLGRELGIAPGDAVVAMVGRMIPGKGFDVFLRSVALAGAALGRPLVALAVGDGPERPALERQAASLGGSARAVFAGYRRDATALLGLADAVLFPSQLTEVLPMALIEASAAGVPVVCSDIAGNREVVQERVNGELAGPGEQSYADVLARVLRDPEAARRMGEAGRRIALERFDESVVVPRVIALYAEVVAR